MVWKIFIYSYIFYLFVICVCLHEFICTKSLWWNEEIIKSTGTGITYGCNLAVGYENPGPLQKQELLLSTWPSLQTPLLSSMAVKEIFIR